MKRLISTIGGAAIALSLMSAAPAFAGGKPPVDTGPTNPTSSTSTLVAKPKDPAKKIVKQTFYPNGNIKSSTTCTFKGQQFCH